MTAVVEVVEESRESARAVTAVPLEAAPEVVRALTRLSFAPTPGADVVGYVGRNDNWGLTVSGGRGVFVKRLTGPAEETSVRLARAVAFAALVGASPPRHWHAAELLGSDPDARLLVFEQVPGSVSAGERADDLDVGLARRIGRAVGELHSMAAASPPAPEPPSPRQANRLAALTLEQYAQCSGAEIEAWALLQHDKQLRRALAALAEQSRAAPQVPSHRDLRLDQILLAGDRIHLIDWEEYGPADPAVDVGSFIGEWLYRAASAMFADAGEQDGASADAHAALVRRGARELEVVRPLVMAFWSGYRQQHPPDAGLAARATAYAGWHLFDRVLARARYSAYLGALERGIAGIGRNALIGGPEFVETIGLEDA
jgi:aminoglycoside phosphotransferase (APT) family kinase protein